jgi:putative tryptophan/tyrosine transport system substrate-binding protein
VKRREFFILLGGAAAAWPLAARAQQPGKVPTIGFLGANSAAGQREWMAAFVTRLGELGWVEGRTVAIEYRWAEGHFDRAPALVAELLRLKVDIIVTHGTPDVLAAKQATSDIPIVFAVAGDPVGNRLVESLARPGGNVTGLSIQSPELVGKRVELLREMVPELASLGLLMNAANTSTPLEQQELEASCRTLGLRLETMLVRQPEEIVAAIETLRTRAQVLYVPLDPLFNSNSVRLNAAAITARMPTMYSTRDGVQAGGLIAYGPSITANFRRAAELTDKILRGAKPADIPVEQSAKFDLVVNLKTAKALRLDVPASLLARADEVIE